MVVPQECRRIGASAFVVFDIVPAGGAAQLLPMAQTAAAGGGGIDDDGIVHLDVHAVAQTAEGRVEAAAPGALAVRLARLLARAHAEPASASASLLRSTSVLKASASVLYRVAADGSDAAPVAVDEGAAARDGGDAGGTTGGWPTAGFAQRPSRGADGNSIDVPAASAAILAAVAVGGVVAAALCLLCFRSGLGGRRAKQKHRTGSSEERTALTAVLEIPVV